MYSASKRICAPPRALLNRWVSLGAYFGYPKCCVKDFLARAISNYRGTPTMAPYQRAAARKQGFVPCQRCAMNLLLLKRQGPESLIRNRICTAAYPEDGTPDALEHYIDTAPKHDDHDHTALPIFTL